jgi:hypothetical protein
MKPHTSAAGLTLALLALLASLAPAPAVAQPAQPVGPRVDRPQMHFPAATEHVVEVLASVSLNGGADAAMLPSPLALHRQFARNVGHPFDLTRPTGERYSAYEDFRDATWQTYRAKGDLPLDWQRLLAGAQSQGCEQGAKLTVHYQVRYQAKPTYALAPGKPQLPPDQPAPGTPDRSKPTPEGVPAANTAPAGLRLQPGPTAVSNVVSDSICALPQQ